MKKIVNWLDFVSFIKSEDLWSRWSMMYDPNQEVYFEANLMLVSDNRTGHNFDFDKLNNVHVLSRDESSVNWDHDGESLWYFFQKWQQGVRL